MYINWYRRYSAARCVNTCSTGCSVLFWLNVSYHHLRIDPLEESPTLLKISSWIAAMNLSFCSPFAYSTRLSKRWRYQGRIFWIGKQGSIETNVTPMRKKRSGSTPDVRRRSISDQRLSTQYHASEVPSDKEETPLTREKVAKRSWSILRPPSLEHCWQLILLKSWFIKKDNLPRWEILDKTGPPI